MPTLRDRVRETLSAREPSGREAAAHREAVLARARRTADRKGRRVWLLVAGPALAAALLALYLAFPRRDASPPPPPPPLALGDRGVHLYLHVDGEPESQAVALDLDSKGDL